MKTLTITLSLFALVVTAMPLSASADRGHKHHGAQAFHQHNQPVHYRKHKQKHQKRRFARNTNNRLENQEDRILNGLVNGRLTYNETKRLVNQHQRLERLQRRIKSDGRITRHERKRFNRLMRKSNRTIYRLKNNHRDAHRPVVHYRY